MISLKNLLADMAGIEQKLDDMIIEAMQPYAEEHYKEYEGKIDRDTFMDIYFMGVRQMTLSDKRIKEAYTRKAQREGHDKCYQALIKKVEAWGEDKGITGPDNVEAQVSKFLEETQELRDEIKMDLRGYHTLGSPHPNLYDIKMELGDVLVTLIILCKQLDITMYDCLAMAYDKIKDRKGKTIDGTFVKEEDLYVDR